MKGKTEREKVNSIAHCISPRAQGEFSTGQVDSKERLIIM